MDFGVEVSREGEGEMRDGVKFCRERKREDCSVYWYWLYKGYCDCGDCNFGFLVRK